jgi:hypothetical protein
MNESTELKGPILCEHCGSPIDATPVRVNAGTAGKPWNLLPGWFHQRCGGAARAAYLAAEDDLGDTPEHLRELLRDVRKVRPDAVLAHGDERFKVTAWFKMDADFHGWNFDGDFDRAEFFERKNTVGWWADMFDKARLQTAILEGRVYPTADARRIGREEFGMVFDGYALPPEEPVKAVPPCACGATSNLRTVVIERSASVTVYANRCGACEQERRRTELLADMDRKLPPKKPEKSLAPASWPEQFSGSSWEE